MNIDSIRELRLALRDLSNRLRILTPGALAEAEQVLTGIVEEVRALAVPSSADLTPVVADLALCRQMIVQANQFWEHRRVRMMSAQPPDRNDGGWLA